MTNHAHAEVAPDVLIRIFSLCCPSADNGRQSLKCLAYSQVCQYWRDVALSTPLLWTFPLFDFPDIAKMMLQRASDVLIPIVQVRLTPKTLPVVLDVLRTREGIRQVMISGNHYLMKQAFTIAVEIPSLQLMDASQAINPRRTGSTGMPMGYGSVDMSFTSPQLMSLRLGDYFPVVKDIGPVGNLTRLCLVSHCDPRNVRDLLDLLRHTPLLEHLELDGMLNSRDSDSPSGIRLARMQHIIMANSNLLLMSDFLNHLDLPKCNMTVKAEGMKIRAHQLRALFKDLRTIFAGPVHVLRLTMHTQLSIVLQFRNEQNTGVGSDHDTFTFALHTGSSPDSTFTEYMQTVSESFDVGELEELNIGRNEHTSGRDGGGAQDLDIALHKSPRLRRIVAHDEAANNVCHTFTQMEPTPARAWDQLEHISFYFAGFRAPDSDQYGGEPTLEGLAKGLLRQRRKDGSCVRLKMTFVSCSVRPGQGVRGRRPLLDRDLQPLSDCADVEILYG
jgi:hypothetical protein